MATCPLCDEEVDLDDDVEVSEVIVCSHCDNELEVVSLEPVQLIEYDEEEK
ncbi:MAG: lysine biosynthesis protein LysW [Thermoleophilia bacterium]|nr:lysine biosynthesis protein LysW [Thermoleophilia bacterium]